MDTPLPRGESLRLRIAGAKVGRKSYDEKLKRTVSAVVAGLDLLAVAGLRLVTAGGKNGEMGCGRSTGGRRWR